MTTKKTEISLSTDFNGFFRNDHHKFVVLKTEKLASAVYLISGFIPENDPVRSRLRTCVIGLVSLVTDSERDGKEGDERVFKSRCLEIGSMLAMAERANLISPMNAKVLREEYASLGSFVDQHGHEVFTVRRLVDLSAQAPKESLLGTAQQQSYKGQDYIKDIKKTQNNKRHSSRRDSIMSLFDKKDKITVKDAAESLNGVSEKTIQRELIAMVEEGVLLKEGERRWSVYKKAS